MVFAPNKNPRGRADNAATYAAQEDFPRNTVGTSRDYGGRFYPPPHGRAFGDAAAAGGGPPHDLSHAGRSDPSDRRKNAREHPLGRDRPCFFGIA